MKIRIFKYLLMVFSRYICPKISARENYFWQKGALSKISQMYDDVISEINVSVSRKTHYRNCTDYWRVYFSPHYNSNPSIRAVIDSERDDGAKNNECVVWRKATETKKGGGCDNACQFEPKCKLRTFFFTYFWSERWS